MLVEAKNIFLAPNPYLVWGEKMVTTGPGQTHTHTLNYVKVGLKFQQSCCSRNFQQFELHSHICQTRLTFHVCLRYLSYQGDDASCLVFDVCFVGTQLHI